jgi:hypothetical protein
MPLYRCENCATVFEADRPSCKQCKIDPAKDARFARLFSKLLLIHFDPPTHVRGIGKGHLACMPAVGVGMGGHRATGEPAVVNCKACRATAAWQAAYKGEPVLAADLDDEETTAPPVAVRKVGGDTGKSIAGSGSGSGSGIRIDKDR